MTRFLCAVLGLSSLLSGFAAFAGDPSKAESQKVQGTWGFYAKAKYQYRTDSNPDVINLVRGGDLMKGDVVISSLALEVKDNSFSFSDEALKKGTRKATAKLDAAKTPKEIDLTVEKGKSFLGIYKVEGDILTICIGDEKTRPTAFDIAKGGQVLVQYKKK